MSQYLFTFLLLSCIFQSAVSVFLMWRTTRPPIEPKPQLLKRDVIVPALKREPSASAFNTDRAYVDVSDFGIKFGKRSLPYQMQPEDIALSFGKRSSDSANLYEMSPEELGINFGKRSQAYQSNFEDLGIGFGKRVQPYQMSPEDLGIGFGKRSQDYMNPEGLALNFGKRSQQSDTAFRWLRKQR